MLLSDPPSTATEQRIKPSRLLEARTRFLTAILTSPAYDMEQSTHIDVMEGMLSVFLKRVGELVSTSVFGEEIAASELAGHISPVPATAGRDEAGELATRLEAEQVKRLLRRVTMTSHSDEPGPNGKRNLSPLHLSDLIKGRIKHPGVDADAVLGTSRRRLQETLLKGVFGEDGAEFRLALKIPEWDGEDEEASVEMDDGVNSEFVETVWECVGWDMLDSGV